jgi:O-antigen ligase
MVTIFTMEDRAAGRFDIWTVGWNMFMDNPILGVGLDGFRVAFDHYREAANFIYLTQASKVTAMSTCTACFVPHNIYLEAFADLGIIGGMLLSLIAFSYLKNGYRAVVFYEKNKDQSGKIIATSVTLSFLGLLIFGLTLGLVYYKYFWVSMALIEVINLKALSTNTATSGEIVSEPKQG